MGNEIKVFEKEEFGTVRTLVIDGKVMFCGSDVAKVLGYKRPNDAISGHCRYTVKRSIPHPQSMYKTIEMTFISEDDVYRLIVHSKLPTAKKFEAWVFEEVIPTIVRTGKYDISESKILSEDFKKKITKARNDFTDTLKEHGYTKQHEYIQTTVQMKKELGINKKKDDMTDKEKLAVATSEMLAKLLITDEYGFGEVNPVCVDASSKISGIIEEKKKMLIA